MELVIKISCVKVVDYTYAAFIRMLFMVNIKLVNLHLEDVIKNFKVSFLCKYIRKNIRI